MRNTMKLGESINTYDPALAPEANTATSWSSPLAARSS